MGGTRETVVAAGLVAALAIIPAALDAQRAPAAFPGKPGPIAYSKVDYREGDERVNGIGGLYAHGPRRRQAARQLTTDLGDHSPAYSADGRSIVFVSDDEAKRTSGIYVMRSDGSGRREVTTDGRGGSDPAFFPNGRAIVFARSVEGDSHIFTIRLDGTGLRQLTYAPHSDHDPVVSPNGRRIAFTSDRDRDGRRDRGDIFTMRPDGSRVRILVDGPRREEEADYAPDGRRIVFISNRVRGSNVFVAPVGGQRVRRITNCRPFPPRCRTFSHPAFSPDGRHIAVLSTGTRTSGIDVFRSDGRRGGGGSFDSAGTEEEGFGSRLGAPSWGPRPKR